MEMTQPSIDELLVAHARAGDPETSWIAASQVDVNGKQALTLLAMLELRRHDASPVEAWRVRNQAQRLQLKRFPKARPMGESTIRTRLNELTKSGMVQVVDRKGLTEANGTCKRFTLTPKGFSEAKEIRDETD
jgi:hypothetical protein